MGWESKKLVETTANKAKSCYACDCTWEVGEPIFLLKDLIKDNFDMVCHPCGTEMAAAKAKAFASGTSKASVGIMLPFRQNNQDLGGKLDDVISGLEEILKELREINKCESQ